MLRELHGAKWDGLRMISKNIRQHIDERALPVGSGSIQQKPDLLCGQSGQATSKCTLDVANQLLVATADLLDEFLPFAALGCGLKFAWGKRPNSQTFPEEQTMERYLNGDGSLQATF